VTATALLAELQAAGIHLMRDGDDLRYQTRPGVSITSFITGIRQHKPALLAELHLREEIVAAATTAQAAFDRAAYDRLWERWHALQDTEAT
jgi:hypothetical protein